MIDWVEVAKFVGAAGTGVLLKTGLDMLHRWSTGERMDSEIEAVRRDHAELRAAKEKEIHQMSVELAVSDRRAEDAEKKVVELAMANVRLKTENEDMKAELRIAKRALANSQSGEKPSR